MTVAFFLIAHIDRSGATTYYQSLLKDWTPETHAATVFQSAQAAQDRAATILHRSGTRLVIMRATTTVEPFQDVPLEDEEPTPQIIYLLSCADNPGRYLGRDGSWVDFFTAPCFPKPEEALAWRAEMARRFPKLNFKSNAILCVREVKPGTVTFKTADADGNIHPHPLSKYLNP